MKEIEHFTRQEIAVQVIEGFGAEPDEQAEPIAMGRQTLWGGLGKPPSREVMAAAAKATTAVRDAIRISGLLQHEAHAAHQAGARRAFYSILRLPWELSPLFRQWLEQHYPDRAQRVMSCVQAMRGGKDYSAAFGQRQRGQGLWADLFRQRFERACRQHGLNQSRFELRTDLFRAPRLDGQAQLF